MKNKKREGIVQDVDSDVGECACTLGFIACAMRLHESHRDGVIALMLH